jgi:hypothetical protein
MRDEIKKNNQEKDKTHKKKQSKEWEPNWITN